MSPIRLIMAGVALFAVLVSNADSNAADAAKKKKKPWNTIPIDTCPEGVNKPSVHCSATVAGAFDAKGRFWVAWSNDGRVYVNARENEGQGFSAPVPVNAAPQAVDRNGENRPKLAIGPGGEIYVSYVIRADKPYTGDLFFSRSLDGGETFQTARSINDGKGKSSLRFEALGVTQDGVVYLSWLDKRDLFLAKAAKQPYIGSAIYFSLSTDRGATFTANAPMAHHTCECCRVAMDMDRNGLPAVVWRHIFGENTRDHAIQRFTAPDQPGEMGRLSVDDWSLDACPHHGPSISIDDKEVFHTTWFTGGTVRQGAFYARSVDGGKNFSDIRPIGTGEDQAEHPFVMARGGVVYLVWKDFSEETTRLRLSTSTDGGKTWSEDRTIAVTEKGSDHPLLAALGTRLFASWRTDSEGFRLFALHGE
jgi:hypothetical protein